jgi:hypothetical protein
MSKLETNIIAPSTGTTITIGESGDTVALGSGATQTGFGGTNTPAFLAHKSGGTQSVSSDTLTKITFQTELFDTDNNFASSTFTPTTSGKYLVFAAVSAQGNITTAGWIPFIKLNGSTDVARTNQYHSGGQPEAYTSTIVSMNGTTDYLEVYLYQTSGSSQLVNDLREHTYFGGYKIIE